MRSTDLPAFLADYPAWMIIACAAVAAVAAIWIFLKALKWFLWIALIAVLLAGGVLVAVSLIR